MVGLITANSRIVIENFCPYTVYVHMTITAPDVDGLMATLEQGQRWIDDYRRTTVGGVAIKLTTAQERNSGKGQVPMTQFEYTFESQDGRDHIQYNLSNRDCRGNCPNSATEECPFMKYGFLVEHQGCTTRQCLPGEAVCKAAYNADDDDDCNDGCWLDNNPDDTFLFLCQYNVPANKLRRSRLWRRDLLSSENIVYLETQVKN